MRIIHYIDSIKAGNLLSDQLLRLTSAQEEYADVKTITQQGDFKSSLLISNRHRSYSFLLAVSYRILR